MNAPGRARISGQAKFRYSSVVRLSRRLGIAATGISWVIPEAMEDPTGTLVLRQRSGQARPYRSPEPPQRDDDAFPVRARRNRAIVCLASA